MPENADPVPCRLLLTPEALEGLAEKNLESRQGDDTCRLLSAHSSRRCIERIYHEGRGEGRGSQGRGQGKPGKRVPPLCCLNEVQGNICVKVFPPQGFTDAFSS